MALGKAVHNNRFTGSRCVFARTGTESRHTGGESPSRILSLDSMAASIRGFTMQRPGVNYNHASTRSKTACRCDYAVLIGGPAVVLRSRSVYKLGDVEGQLGRAVFAGQGSHGICRWRGAAATCSCHDDHQPWGNLSVIFHCRDCDRTCCYLCRQWRLSRSCWRSPRAGSWRMFRGPFFDDECCGSQWLMRVTPNNRPPIRMDLITLNGKWFRTKRNTVTTGQPLCALGLLIWKKRKFCVFL